MITKTIVIVGIAVGVVALMYVLGRMADGKSDNTDKKDAEQNS